MNVFPTHTPCRGELNFEASDDDHQGLREEEEGEGQDDEKSEDFVRRGGFRHRYRHHGRGYHGYGGGHHGYGHGGHHGYGHGGHHGVGWVRTHIPMVVQSSLNITIISVSSKPIVILRLITILRL